MDQLQPLILESLQLLLLGMGTVFVILVLLIVLITLVSRMFADYQDEPLHDGVRRPGSVHASSIPSADTQDQVIAVISAAVSAYRHRHTRK